MPSREEGGSVTAFGRDGRVYIWRWPRALEGPVERLKLWAEVSSRTELTNDGEARDLDAAKLERRRGRPPLRGPAARRGQPAAVRLPGQRGRTGGPYKTLAAALRAHDVLLSVTDATVSVSTTSEYPTARALRLLSDYCEGGHGFLLNGAWCVCRGGSFVLDDAADPASRPGGEAATG